MGTIKGKREFNRINGNLDELYKRINDETYNYKGAGTSWFIESCESILNEEVLNQFLTYERVEAITDMTKQLASHKELSKECVTRLNQLVKRLNEFIDKYSQLKSL